jgi:hypothetical protein
VKKKGRKRKKAKLKRRRGESDMANVAFESFFLLKFYRKVFFFRAGNENKHGKLLSINSHDKTKSTL